MKNIYLYGASDDCHEVETDFDRGHEGYGDIMINGVRAQYTYDGDWTIRLFGDVPPTWVIRTVRGTSTFIHIQVPDDETITYKDVQAVEE